MTTRERFQEQKNARRENEANEILFLAFLALEKCQKLTKEDSKCHQIAKAALIQMPFFDARKAITHQKLHPKSRDWPLIVIDYLNTIPDEIEEFDYDPSMIAISAGYKQSGIGNKKFGGDLFIDDHNRCFSIVAKCSWAIEDHDGDYSPWDSNWEFLNGEYHETPKYETRNGVDVSSMEEYEQRFRRTNKDCPRVRLWTRQSALRHQLEMSINPQGISKVDQFFLMSGAADAIANFHHNQTK